MSNTLIFNELKTVYSLLTKNIIWHLALCLQSHFFVSEYEDIVNPKHFTCPMDYYGPQLNALMKKNDWSQKTLALTLKKSPQYVNALIHNKKKLSDGCAEQIASLLHLTLSEFKNCHQQSPSFVPSTKALKDAPQTILYWKQRALAAEALLTAQ
jgi:hypothetical protein